MNDFRKDESSSNACLVWNRKWIFFKLLLLPIVFCSIMPNSSEAQNNVSLGTEEIFWRKVITSTKEKADDLLFVSNGFKDKILITYNDLPEVATTEGYEIQSFSTPIPWQRRVIESRTGQIWSSSKSNIYLLRGEEWITYPILPDQTSTTETIRGILPAEYNHVLILVSNRLIEYNALSESTSDLLLSSDLPIGEFLDIRLARDQGAWIIGTQGISKISPPIRNVSLRSNIQHFPIKKDENTILGSRIFEVEPGMILVEAFASNPVMEGVRIRKLLLLNNGIWKTLLNDFESWEWILNPEVRRNILIKNEIPEKLIFELRTQPSNLENAKIRDLAVMSDGHLLVATDKGLFKECPFLWKPESKSNVLAVLDYNPETDEMHVLGNQGLGSKKYRSNTINWELSWPENLEADISPDKLLKLRRGAEDTFFIQYGMEASSINLNEKTWTNERFESSDGSRLTYRALNDSGDFIWLWIADIIDREQQVIWGKNNLGENIPINTLPQYMKEESRVFDLSLQETNKIWIATSRGLVFLNNESWEYFGYEMIDESTLAKDIVIQPRTSPILASDSGILEFTGEKIVNNLITSSPIKQIFQSKIGQFWTVTDKNVYRLFDETWVNVQTDSERQNIKYHSIFEDSNNQIWLSSNLGIFRFTPSSDFDPPETVIVNKPQEVIPNRDGIVAISLNSVDKWRYTLVKDLLYSHRINDGPWSPFTNLDSVNLSNLPEGIHKFEARSMDINGNIDLSPDVWNFKLNIPWYYDTRVVVMVFITAISLLFLCWTAFDRHRTLQRSYRDVEKMVKKRTAQLEEANEQLLMHKKMRAMGALSSGIAHDFNSILSIVQGSAQIIKANIHDPEKIEKRVTRIETVVNQGSSLVKAMLGFAKQKYVEPNPVDLEFVVKSTLEILNDKKPTDVVITIKTQDEIPEVAGSNEYFQQVLVNLILNAFDALNNSGSIEIKMTLTPQSFGVKLFQALEPQKQKDLVYLSVLDFGSGIPQDIVERIFEPFFTTKALSTKKGTGLGLSMVYELAQQMHLGLQVGSIKDEFTVFILEIPTFNKSSKHH